MDLVHHLPKLTAFAWCLLLTLTVPRLMQRLRLPGPIGFIVAGILLGPQVFGVIPTHGPFGTLSRRGQEQKKHVRAGIRSKTDCNDYDPPCSGRRKPQRERRQAYIIL